LDGGEPADGTDVWSTASLVTLSVEVTNTSAIDGAEVVQAYVPLALGTHAEPLLTLRGFARADVPAGSTVRIPVRVHVPDGVRRIHVGRSADPTGHSVVVLPA
jgi:hypothetical protein